MTTNIIFFYLSTGNSTEVSLIVVVMDQIRLRIWPTFHWRQPNKRLFSSCIISRIAYHKSKVLVYTIVTTIHLIVLLSRQKHNLSPFLSLHQYIYSNTRLGIVINLRLNYKNVLDKGLCHFNVPCSVTSWHYITSIIPDRWRPKSIFNYKSILASKNRIYQKSSL